MITIFVFNSLQLILKSHLTVYKTLSYSGGISLELDNKLLCFPPCVTEQH